MEREERDGERPEQRSQGGRGTKGHPPLQPFMHEGISPEVEREMHERAWARFRGEAERLEEKDREVAVREHRVRQDEAAAARMGPTSPSPEPTPPD